MQEEERGSEPFKFQWCCSTSPWQTKEVWQIIISKSFSLSRAQFTVQNAVNITYFPGRQKAPGSKSSPSGTPGSTTKRKAASTPRAPDTSRSPGPTTRRRAAALLVSPRSWWSSYICCNQCVFLQLDVWCKCGHPVLCKVSALICWCNCGIEVSCYLCKLIFAVGSL
jgi:hypothetical protein